MLGISKITHCNPLHQQSYRFATVVVGGSAKNHGSPSPPGKRRGPKVTGGQLVNKGNILVKQRWWIENDQMWHGGFNVHRGDKGILNAMIKGKVLYYYDTNEKRKYVSVVPEGEDPRDYMRPFHTPFKIYKMAKERAIRRVKWDSSVNVNRKNKEMAQYRNAQLDFMNQIESIPMELIMMHEQDKRFKDKSFGNLCENIDQLQDIKPVYENEQIEYAIRNKLEFELDQETIAQRRREKQENKEKQKDK
eukprot:120152_1